MGFFENSNETFLWNPIIDLINIKNKIKENSSKNSQFKQKFKIIVKIINYLKIYEKDKKAYVFK